MKLQRLLSAAAVAAFATASGGTCAANHLMEIEMPLTNLESTRRIDRIDPEPGGEFPGGRESDQLIAYTPGYGERTGTNDWGMEAVVDGGRVVSLGGNDSAIPADGLVLSGHGTAMEWLKDHALPGARVTVDGDTARVVFDETSRALFVTLQARELREWRSTRGGLPPEMHDRLKAVESDSAGFADPAVAADPEAVAALADRLHEELVRTYFETSPAPADMRAAWHRPVETTPEAIEETMARVARGGINRLYLEVLWAGRTIYASTIAEQHGNFRETPDYFGEWIRAGRRHGVAVCAWVHVFQVGAEEFREWGPLARQHPDWLMVDRNGRVPFDYESGHVFTCPNEPRFHDWFFAILDEIAAHEGIAGIQLDYIRFPGAAPFDAEYCLCSRCVRDFHRKTGWNARLVTADSPEEQRDAWLRFRADSVTRYVRETRDRFPDIEVSAAVFHDIERAYLGKAQDWVRWGREGWVDALFPMVYVTSSESVADAVSAMVEAVPDVPVIVGLAPYLKLPETTFLRQIEVARESGGEGVALFAVHSIDDRLTDLLGVGPFRKP